MVKKTDEEYNALIMMMILTTESVSMRLMMYSD